ncbi:MAG: transposase family protein [Candidatus Competibacteraceae bacterium]
MFSEVWNEHTHQHEKDPTKGGRNPILKTIQDRLFFILSYLKVYPIQEVLAHLFGMSQGQANFYLDELSAVLRKTLTGVKRCRIVKDIFRNTTEGYDDLVMELACGLHNFRTEHRLLCY